MRKLHIKRYQTQLPEHHIQVEVKFLTFIGKHLEKVRRFQSTAIDNATRVRTLKVSEKRTQANAISFIDHIIETFPFRFREVRTDNGHELQARFHGMSTTSAPGTPTSNAERFSSTEKSSAHIDPISRSFTNF
ncbi:hypothetical protein SAMN05444000_13912 [Shimia gijangensis]|uniref:Integrase core domain-containing protein n=1 Tax=Shimia gijangensis TaxID=1470563 RepID=A0A1M6TGI6_9RHOB|nr:hypothetical protein SAMN05444000_13912 [Shimia gijangensis]